MNNKTIYVCGIVIQHNKVVFILKNKPDFLIGKLCFVGGKVENNELPISAISREFEEETGVKTKTENWNQFHYVDGIDYELTYFLYDNCNDIIFDVRTIETEEIIVLDLNLINNFENYAPDVLEIIKSINNLTIK